MGGYSLPIEDLSAYNVDPVEELRKRQEESLQAHQAYAQGLQEKQAEVDLRSQDLNLAKLAVQAMSPETPAAARKFLLNGLSQSVGVDPKGDYSKQLQTMLAGLDPQSMEAVRRSFADQINAPPGKIKESLNGIFTGKVPVSDLLTQVAAKERALIGSQGSDTLAGGGPQEGDTAPTYGMVVTKPKEFDRLPTTPEVQPGAPQPDKSPMAAARITPAELARSGQVLRRPTQGETAPRDKPVDPAFLDVLGYDSTVKARNQDILRDYPRAPVTEKGQQEMTARISEQAANTTSGILGAIRLHNLFMGRPETLGISGGVVRTVDEVIDQIKAAADLAGGASKDLDFDKPGIRQLIVTTADKIHDLYKKTNIADVAVDSARIQSQVLQMAYDLAIARGIPGNRLTNNIIAQQLTTLGKSASEAQFQGVLKDVVQRSTEEGTARIRAELGSRDFYPSLSHMPDNQFDEVLNYMERAKSMGRESIVPAEFKDALEREAQKRLDVAQGGTGAGTKRSLALSEPTIQQEDKAFQEERARQVLAEETKIAQGQQGLNIQQTSEERRSREEARKYDLENRRIQEADRRYELQLQKEQRAAQQERQKQIIQAFQHLGASIAGSIKERAGGLIGDQGGGQDSGAFQIRPPPARSAPRPVDASAYQRGRK